jgi:hypothetical protein
MRYSNTVSSYLDMKDINNSVYVRLHLSYVYCTRPHDHGAGFLYGLICLRLIRS